MQARAGTARSSQYSPPSSLSTLSLLPAVTLDLLPPPPPLLQDMSLRLLGKLVKAECPELQGRAAADKAGKLAGAISAVKNSMVTWHAATPQV